MSAFKEFCKDFPTQGGSVVVALMLIFFTGIAVIGRLTIGEEFPDGYEPWLLFLGAIATGSFAAMIGKRLSDFRYKQAGTSPVNVEAPSNVTVEASLPDAPTPAPAPVEPRNAIRIEQTSAATARDMTRGAPSATQAEADY